MDKQEKRQNMPYHDFMLERKWLMIVMGFGESRSALYVAYIIAIFIFFIYEITMAVNGIRMVFNERTLVVDGLHVLVNSSFLVGVLGIRVSTDKALYNARTYIRSGFYTYRGEELFEEQLKMIEDGVEETRVRSRDFVRVWSLGAMAVVTLFPISQLMIVTEEEYERKVEVANPYLPGFFHTPYSTRTPASFALSFFASAMFFFYAAGSGMAMNEIYTSCILQLRAQLRVLNYSIRHIHRRAGLLYAKRKGIPYSDVSVQLICKDPLYQKCLTHCLRANVEHHQSLLRFNDEILKFSGAVLLLIVNVAALAFATNFYAIMQGSTLNSKVKCSLVFFVEQTYSLYLCVFGESIMTESAELFESIYSVPWFYYNKEFNQTLQLFMCYTMKPIKIKSNLLDLTASLETYASFFSAMYKIVNVLNQSDTV